MEMSALPTPRVSVVIPCYNAAGSVARAIESVLATGCPDLEIVAVDDGSCDETAAVVSRFAAEHPSVRVRLLRHPDGGNHGAARTRNLGLAAAEGTYVAFLDCDDVYFPNRFQTCLPLLDRDAGLDGCFEPFIFIQGGGQRAAEMLTDPGQSVTPEQADKGAAGIVSSFAADPFMALLGGSCWVHSNTITVRREILRAAGGFPDVKFAEDMGLWLKLFSRYRIPQAGRQPVAGYRIHAGSLCSREADTAGFLLAPLRAQLAALAWMWRSGVEPRKIGELKKAIWGKLYDYAGRTRPRGRSWTGPMLGAMGRVLAATPELAFSVRFWKVLALMVAAWLRGEGRAPLRKESK